MNRFAVRPIFFIIAMFLLAGSLNAQGSELPKESFDSSKALTLLYGGLIWKDNAIGKYFKGKSTGYLSVAFESSYVEDGIEKRITVVHITPEPAEEYKCHACNPLIGGAVFVKEKEGWTIESKSQIIGWSSSFGEKMSLVSIGANRYGVLLAIEDAHQGYETKVASLIVPYEGTLRVALEAGFGDGLGPGACGKRAPKQKVEMKFEGDHDSDYFDVVTNVQQNKGSCGRISTKRATIHHKFASGKYIRATK